MASQSIVSPFPIPGRNSCFSSSLPMSRMVLAMDQQMAPAAQGTLAQASSSNRIIRSTLGRSAPPYFLGQVSGIQPF